MGLTATAPVAGLLGTAGMTCFLWIVDRTAGINANMVRALGSGVTRRVENTLVPGLLIHSGAGIVFAFLYLLAFRSLGVHGVLGATSVGVLLGLVHGFGFAFVMVVLDEHHPVREYQEATFAVALVHMVAHIVYGLVVGFVAGMGGYVPPVP